MTESLNQSTAWPSRRLRILALTKSLIDDLGSVDLTEIDGEFYWRICRDDLLDPLTQLAASIAPHVVDADARIDQFDDAQLRAIDAYRRELDDLDDEMQHRLLERLKMRLKAQELFSVGQPFVEQLPDAVWQHFAAGQRIPMRPPLRTTFTDGGHVMEVRVFSRTVTGAALEDVISSHPGRRYLPRDPDPSSGAALDDLEQQELAPHPIAAMSLRIDANLVTASAPSPPLVPGAPLEDLPYISIRLRRPIPPPGVVRSWYDASVRDWHRWHLDLPGGESRQERRTAIWIWSVGLLMATGDDFYAARWAVEEQTGLDLKQPPPSLTWFGKSRAKLVDRVPEAEHFLFRRRSRLRPSAGSYVPL
jgi:hypothetical protein